MLHALRVALRTHLRRPLFAALVVTLLAIGVGANTAVLGLADAVLLRPFEFHQQDRLAMLWLRDRTRNVSFIEMPYPDYSDLAARSRTFENVAAMSSVDSTFNLTGEGRPEVIVGRGVTANFFDVLGAHAALGRTFSTADATGQVAVGVIERRNDARADAVLSNGFWRRRFGGDRTVVGRSLRLNGDLVTVIGVMPRDFDYPAGVDLWTNLEPGLGDLAADRATGWLVAIGRLTPGITLDQAATESNTVFRDLLAGHAPGINSELTLTPLVDTIVRQSRTQILLLACAVGLLLLIACANVAGLMLARGASRTREIATRLALGAHRGQIVRQLMIEAMPLAAAGALFGIALAWVGTAIMRATVAADIPRLGEVSLNWRLVAFASALAIITALVASLAPIRQTSRLSRLTLTDALRTNAPQAAGGGGLRSLRGGLVAGQIALTLMLLVASGLMLRSLANYERIDLGFDPDKLLTFEMPVVRGGSGGVGSGGAGSEAQTNRFFEQVVERLRTLPGVDGSAAVLLRPLWSTVGLDWPYQVDSQTPDDARRNPLVNLESATPSYFETMRIAVRAGRAFTTADQLGTQGVAIVSESFARQSWGNASALGRRLKMPLPDSPYHQQWLTVVGVVADVRYRALDVPRLDVYMAAAQSPYTLRHIVLRAHGDPAALVPSVRAEILAADPNQPITDVRPMADIVERTLGARRLHTRILVLFAAVAMGLAATGLYAVLAQLVQERTREIGVRVALGARPAQVMRHVIGAGLKLAVAGLAAGALASALTMRVMSSLVFGVETSDPTTYSVSLALVVVVFLAASLVPALRAATLDPAQALKQE